MQLMRALCASGSYALEIESGILGRLGGALRERLAPERALIVTDERVWMLYGSNIKASLAELPIEVQFLRLPTGGGARTLEALRAVESAMNGMRLGGADALVAVGGGALCDMCGYCAWNHKDVIQLAQFPTTLLAMADWAAGGKTALESKIGRCLGGFFKPSRVFVDPSACLTLTDRAFSAGLAEIIKCGCVADAPLFHMLASLDSRAEVERRAEELIWRCLDLKTTLTLSGDGAKLLFGHQLAYAVETAQRYKGLTHGEAVAVGMLATARYACARGLSSRGADDRLEECLARHGLFAAMIEDAPEARAAVSRLGARAVPLVERPGWSAVRSLNDAFFSEAWEYSYGGKRYAQ